MAAKTAMIEQRDSWNMNKTGWRQFEFRYTHEMTAKELSELPAGIILQAAVRDVEITPLAHHVMVQPDGTLVCNIKDEFVTLAPDETVLVHLHSIEKFEREIERAREMIKALAQIKFAQAARDAMAKRAQNTPLQPKDRVTWRDANGVVRSGVVVWTNRAKAKVHPDDGTSPVVYEVETFSKDYPS